MDIDLGLARRHVDALRNYRVPAEAVGTVAVLDWLIAEVERLRGLCAEKAGTIRILREELYALRKAAG